MAILETVYVYFIRQEGRHPSIKVGISNNPESRLISLQVASPVQLYLMCKIPFKSRSEARAVEVEIHQKYKAYNLGGEWFSSGKKLVRLISKTRNNQRLQDKGLGRYIRQ